MNREPARIAKENLRPESDGLGIKPRSRASQTGRFFGNFITLGIACGGIPPISIA
jgi:hypothetical protein